MGLLQSRMQYSNTMKLCRVTTEICLGQSAIYELTSVMVLTAITKRVQAQDKDPCAKEVIKQNRSQNSPGSLPKHQEVRYI